MNRLLHGGGVERAVVVAPETLTVQWLGELWRKYHQVFVLLDEARLKDVERDHGEGFNPFDVHRRVILSTELLTSEPRLRDQALDAGVDLLVLDEAHHLRRRSGQPGNAAYRAFAPLAAAARHLLLLTATPLEDDVEGFFRLLQLLRPDELPESDFEGGDLAGLRSRLERREPLPPCTSATRRADIGGLPPRVAWPVPLDAEAWEPQRAFLRGLRASADLESPLGRRRLAERLRLALSSPAALERTFDDEALEALRRGAADADPRTAWLVEKTWTWAQAGEKTLIFVADRPALEALRSALPRVQVGIFHEDLSLERRDVEVARFRLPEGPSVLISTESGGEGRNFEFCRRLVLFDLPWHPATVEQRIGRLDRIGRELPTEIVYFKPPSGFPRVLVELYESLGLFEHPLGGLVRELRQLAEAIVEQAVRPEAARLDDFEAVLRDARSAQDRVREAAHHELHRDPYVADMADSILARVPAELDALCEDVVTRAAARFGFGCETQSGARTWLIEFGSQALIDHLPGVTPGSRFLGTFDRERAVANEDLEFFASGHPLVEGVLAELEDGDRGRATFFAAGAVDGDPAFGLLALFNDDTGVDAVAVDEKGELRPDVAERLFSGDVEFQAVDAARWTGQRAWKRAVKTMSKALPEGRRLSAIAAFRLVPGL
ncbi:MAG: helicase-related protein [Acidobacteriota bacterium]